MKRRFRVRRILHGYSEKVVEANGEHEAREIADAIVMKPEQVMNTLSSDGIMGGFDVDVDEVDDSEELTELTEDDKRNVAWTIEWLKKDRAAMGAAAKSLGLPLD